MLLAAATAAALALSPVTLPAHERFMTEVAMVTTPTALGAVASLLNSRGEEIVEPGVDATLHPLLIPLTRDTDGETTGLLRWPTAGGGGSKLPLVRTTQGGQQLTLLANSAEHYLAREAALADVSGASDAEAIAAASGEYGFPYTAGTAAASAGGLDGYLITKVAPFVACYELLAIGHRAKGDAKGTTAALVTCEASQGKFDAWGRPFAFHARMLDELSRAEEARDKARGALERPWWTMGDDVDEVLRIAEAERSEQIAKLRTKADGKLTPQELASQNGMEKRTPAQIAKDRASYLLDLAVAAPDEYSWAGIREELADRYAEANMKSIADFVRM